jgi:adenylate cyclase
VKITKQFLLYFLLIVVSIGLWVSLTVSGALDGIEEETLRWRYLARGELESTAPIVFVDLDADAVSYMGARPWDRRNFGVLLRSLLEPGGAKVVSVDVILSKYGAGGLLDLERARKGEAFLGEVVKEYPEKIILAAGYTGVPATSTGEQSVLPLIRLGKEKYDPERNPFPEAPNYPVLDAGVGRLGLANVDEGLSGGKVPYFVPGFVELDSPRYGFHLVYGALRHKEHFMNEPYAKVIGDQVVLTDKDGFTTDSFPTDDSLTFFSLGLETFLAAEEIADDSVKISAEALTLYRDEQVYRRIPLVEYQSIEVNWFEDWDRKVGNERISMKKVLSQADALGGALETDDVAEIERLKNWFAQFRDKVVFVGPVDPQLKDLAPTPFNRDPAPKVGFHANLYRTIQDEAYIRRVGLSGTIALVSILSLAVSLLALGRGLPRTLSAILFGGYVLAAFLSFGVGNWVLPLVAPLASTVTAASSVIFLKLGSEEWQRRRIKNLFGAYVSPELVNDMVESQRDPELGGTKAEVTALFSDVEGFSSLSEQLSPERLVALMNEYLGAMTETFQTYQGTLDKYIGDAIVTMFGMPYPVKDHAARACLSAIAMQERHSQLRKKWAESGDWPQDVVNMRTRIGVNTGIAVIGNMGSEMRFNYTMMGDSVNLAARCESGAKSYGVYTMVTASTLEAALREGAELNYRKLDRIVVKGRSQPVEVYELWDSSLDPSAAESCRSVYEAALEQYFAGQWGEALAGFEKCEALEPARTYAPTTPSAVLAIRCREFAVNGGPGEWDGAYRMTTK